jgi:hypothetical protein
MSISGMELHGVDAGMFRILEEVQAFTLAPGETHSAELRFIPTQEREAHAQLWFNYTGTGTPAVIELKGNGVQSSSVSSRAEQAAGTLQMSVTPNPSSESATIGFTLDRSVNVRVTLVDASGREVVVVTDGRMEPGQHSVHIDLSELASGQYYCLVSAGQAIATRPLQIVR